MILTLEKNIHGKEKNYMIDNSQKIFIDTNILVYAHDLSTGEKHRIAKELISTIWNNQNGHISIQVLQEFYVTITEKVKNPIDKVTVSSIIEDLGKWTVHSPDADDIITAVTIQTKYKLSFWDSMIICSAIKTKCDIIISEDFTHNQKYEGILLLDPFI
jgi:predicted nucleic acid-binding protein